MSTAQHVLVPVDFLADDSDAAVELAATLIKANGGNLVLLHVLAPMGSMSGIVPGARDDEDLEHSREQALAALGRLAQSLRALGVEQVSSIVEVGYPIERILEHARRNAVDVIVLGTHGRTGIPRLWMGSVAELVLRQAPCRVVVVRAGPATACPKI